MNIEIPEDSWSETGSDEDPRSRLLAPTGSLSINGCAMHIEAYALKDQDVQEFADPWFEDEDQAFGTLTQQAVRTIEIKGREYALVVHPYGI